MGDRASLIYNEEQSSQGEGETSPLTLKLNRPKIFYYIEHRLNLTEPPPREELLPAVILGDFFIVLAISASSMLTRR